jgi:hypothetical protein
VGCSFGASPSGALVGSGSRPWPPLHARTVRASAVAADERKVMERIGNSDPAGVYRHHVTLM